MRVLVTGLHGGFVGPHLAGLLEDRDCEVLALEDKGAFVDLRDAALVDKKVEAARPERVYHLAAISSVGESWDESSPVFEVNVGGTRNLLDALARHAPGARVLMVSTAGVYGGTADRDELISEDRELSPRNPYAKSKVMAEAVCIEYAKNRGLDIRRVRPQGHTGPGQKLGFVAPDFASQIAAIAQGKAESVIKTGNLKVAREFADVRDVVRAYWMIMEMGEPGRVYNLATNQPRTIREVAVSLMTAAGVQAELVQDPARVRGVDESSPRLDVSRITALGFSFEIPFERTMADVMHEWLASPA